MDIRIGSLIDGAQAARRGGNCHRCVSCLYPPQLSPFTTALRKSFSWQPLKRRLSFGVRAWAISAWGKSAASGQKGFDFGNSPYELSQAGALTGQTLIQSTQAGTVGVSAAAQADHHLPGIICHGQRHCQGHPRRQIRPW